MKYIDIHAHTQFQVYDTDRDVVLRRAHEAGIIVVNVGTQYDTSAQAVKLAREYNHIYAIVGLHPIHTDKSFHDEKELGNETKTFTSRGEIFETQKYFDLAQSSSKVIAIGECGLDYYRTEPESLEKQKTAFHAQIQLALDLDLPLMLHVRPSKNSMDAYWDVVNILEQYKINYQDRLRGDVHFFAGDVEVARAFLDLGFYLSFTGVITFVQEYEEVIRLAPFERILSETDCPYVAPVPHRGERNEPVFVQEVVKKIAEIKNVPYELMAQQILENAKTLFKINLS